MQIQNSCAILEIKDIDKNELEALHWNRGFTFTDKSILFLAQQHRMLVFLGEKKMKKWCQKYNIESHGILYILKKFIDEGLFEKSIKIAKLQGLMDINQWLPTEICLSLLDK